MERLFTNITNEELTQNNNDLNTGCYAGEREDFMMNGICMTENGLKAENAPRKAFCFLNFSFKFVSHDYAVGQVLMHLTRLPFA